MSETVVNFQSLPPDYQAVIQKAEKRFGIAISPLQELAGGWSGANIYLVRAAYMDSGKVEHLVLKLDRKRPKASSDEVSRYRTVQQESPPEFASLHIPGFAFEAVEVENAMAIFYTIAGQSLHQFRTLASYRQQSQLTTLFTATHHYVLDQWNAALRFEPFTHPQQLLKKWLGFRLNPGQKIEAFLHQTCRLDPEIPGFIVRGAVLPNPLYYARNPDPWGATRTMDAVVGMMHGDLNANNILAKFNRRGDELEGYFLIDFALFKEDVPLLYDQRYLEMSYLIHAIDQGTYSSAEDLIIRYSEHDLLEVDQAPVEMAGANAAIRSGRSAFGNWVRENHPSLHDDLWGQYWLAGTAAGLAYTHKDGLRDEFRLAGLIFAAANLKQYLNLFGLPMPVEAGHLQLNTGEARARNIAHSPASPGKTAPHNLPPAATKFIGRKTSLAEVADLLLQPEVHLVTLTGPGGTGKTRLSLEVGRSLLEKFPHGVFFIDLAQLTDPSLLAATTAHTIGIREGGGRPPLETLKDYLASREMLLIFDNFEQITAAAAIVSDLLSASPGIKSLVTSRIPLQLRWEHEYPVAPLEMPPDTQQRLGELLEVESIALFRQQARAVRPDFEITAANRAALVEICRRLDGLPLAIEIAAARIKMLAPEALLKRLDQSLKLLVGGPVDLPDRHRTLRKTIDWSYQLLEPGEKELFIRLGIFSGGFTLDAAEGVCYPPEGADIFSGIEALLNNSLIRQVQSASDEPRFDMLQTIREFALEKASQAGMLDPLRWAHCEYFAAQIGNGMGVGGWSHAIWLKRCEEEHDNFRAALSWAMENPERGAQPVLIMMEQLTWFWFRHGYLQEGSEWTARAVAATEGLGPSIPRASALAGRAFLALWSGDLLVAERMGREAVELCVRIGFDRGLSMAKLGYGVTLINMGADKKAYPHLVDAVELFDQQADPWMKGTTLVHLANVSLGLDHPEEALNWLNMAMPFIEQSGDIWAMAFSLNNFGEVARTQGRYAEAEAYYRRTEELFTQADAKGDQARLVHTLGYIALHKGEYPEAQALFLESLKDFLKLGNHRGIAECLAGLAGLAAEQGEHSWAVPLLSAAERQLIDFGGAWWPADRVEIERARKQMKTAVGNRFAELWEQGQSMPVEEAIAYARRGPAA